MGVVVGFVMGAPGLLPGVPLVIGAVPPEPDELGGVEVGAGVIGLDVVPDGEWGAVVPVVLPGVVSAGLLTV